MSLRNSLSNKFISLYLYFENSPCPPPFSKRQPSSFSNVNPRVQIPPISYLPTSVQHKHFQIYFLKFYLGSSTLHLHQLLHMTSSTSSSGLHSLRALSHNKSHLSKKQVRPCHSLRPFNGNLLPSDSNSKSLTGYKKPLCELTPASLPGVILCSYYLPAISIMTTLPLTYDGFVK